MVGMRKLRRPLIGLAASLAAACVATSSARAAVGYLVFKGEVAQGQDYAGDFGSVGALSGAFYAIYKFDIAIGGDLQGLHEERLDGGPGTGFANPVLDASLTINGATVHFPGPAGSYGIIDVANVWDTDGVTTVAGFAQAFHPDHNSVLNLVVHPVDAPTRIQTSYAAANGDYLASAGLTYWEDLGVTRFSADLRPVSVYLTDDLNSVVPEPAAWGLMILGFLAVGSALRARRQRQPLSG